MAYLPGLKHDVFISYAREDEDWVTALQEQLTERLRHRLGTECDVWQDQNKIRAGQKWSDEVVKAIRDAAAFLAVISRSYQGSAFCEKELDAFFEGSRSDRPLEAGGYSRFLKVVKFPWVKDAHEGFYPQFHHVTFFDRDPKTGQEREFRQNSAGFRLGVDKLSFHIERLFEAMLRGVSKVYVARVADNDREERDAIARQVKADGYALTPPPDGSIPKGLDRKVLKEFIKDAPVTVHLVGNHPDSMVRTQIDLALELEKRMIFCLARDHEAAAGDAAQLIDDIRENRWRLPDGRWALLENRSRFALMQDLLLLLAPSRPIETPEDTASRVYLVCDPTTPEDASFARRIQDHIREREKMVVDLPQLPVDGFSSAAQHERLISGCDGLLMYCERAPSKWFTRNVADLLSAEHRRRTRELRSKAILTGTLPLTLPDITVIQRSDPFDPNQLEPFLQPLRPNSFHEVHAL
jgi:hypothetical protein